jgi:hypothetical protein
LPTTAPAPNAAASVRQVFFQAGFSVVLGGVGISGFGVSGALGVGFGVGGGVGTSGFGGRGRGLRSLSSTGSSSSGRGQWQRLHSVYVRGFKSRHLGQSQPIL